MGNEGRYSKLVQWTETSCPGLFTPGEKAPGPQWTGDWVGPQSRSRRCGKKKDLLSLTGIEPQFRCRRARGLVAIPDEFSVYDRKAPKRDIVFGDVDSGSDVGSWRTRSWQCFAILVE
jgi:hypothetical protein